MTSEEKKEEETGLIELATLKDLIHLLAHTPFQIINHIEFAEKHYYFIITGGLPGFSRIIYYTIQDTPIKGNFIIYNTLQDTYEFGDKMETRGGISFLPIIHIKKQNILKLEDFNF